MNKFENAIVLAAVSLATAAPAWAGVAPAVPGPLVGAGIPAVLGLAYVYRRIRKARGE